MTLLRACSRCGVLSGEGLCPKHRRQPWEGSQRRSRTISGWAQQRRARFVLRRDNGVCYLCGGEASEADHYVPLASGGADSLSNLRAICKGCHAAKSSREGRYARTGSGAR